MSGPAATPAVPRPAASLVLLQDGREGLEVLMVERPASAAFAPGVLVFPGGKVDADDHVPVAGGMLPDVAFRVAALRETAEETGVALVPGPASGGGHDELIECCSALVPFAHWITPVHHPRRFDTRFFAATAPAGQVPVAAAGEVTRAEWLSPTHVLEEVAAKRMGLMFATYMILKRLQAFSTAEAAIEDARRRPVVTVMPVAVKTPNGPALAIPEDAGYGETLVLESRFR